MDIFTQMALDGESDRFMRAVDEDDDKKREEMMTLFSPQDQECILETRKVLYGEFTWFHSGVKLRPFSGTD